MLSNDDTKRLTTQAETRGAAGLRACLESLIEFCEREGGFAACESPIEQILLAAMLVVAADEGFAPVLFVDGVHRNAPVGTLAASLFLPAWPQHPELKIEPQKAIGSRRVDFCVHIRQGVPDADGRPKEWITRKPVVVECDGHAFHERTPEQAARDRTRDRDLQVDGHFAYRFTGSEIVRDPFKCAAEVVFQAAVGGEEA